MKRTCRKRAFLRMKIPYAFEIQKRSLTSVNIWKKEAGKKKPCFC
jgi:hypothetical protein